jgi:hypothetical protein
MTREFNVTVPLREFFTAGSIASLAALVRQPSRARNG